jgi:hypothetical protein
LNIYPDKQIGIVESEKTAMLCAGHIPEINWLATGNLNNLSAKRIECLKGKKVTLYPDAGAFKIWKDKAEQLKDIASFMVSDLIETRATPEQLKEGYDMADYLTLPPSKSVGCKECEQTAKPTKEDYNTLEIYQRVINEDEVNDSFFEELKAIQPKEKLEVWPVKELEEYFKDVQLPEEPIQLDSSGTIKDLQKFIESNLSIIKLQNGKEIYKPYFDRLIKLKIFFKKTKLGYGVKSLQY